MDKSSSGVYELFHRTDCAQEVNRLAQCLESPTQGTIKAIKRVMAYLAGTTDRLLLVPITTNNEWLAFSDSDHAGDRRMDTRSRTGVLIMLNGMPIHWQSVKQPVTALSSTEAEIYALSETIKAVKHRYWIAEGLGTNVTWPAQVKCDNSACIQFQHNNTSDTKLKGAIQLRDNWVQELRKDGIVTAVKVPTDLNLADMMTKCLSYATRKRLDDELVRLAMCAKISSPVNLGGT